MLQSGQRVTIQGTVIKAVDGEAAFTLVLSDGLIRDFKLYEIKEDNDDDSDLPRLEDRRIEVLEQKLWVAETKLIDIIRKLNEHEGQFVEVESSFEEVERRMRTTILRGDMLQREQTSLSQFVDDKLQTLEQKLDWTAMD